MDGKTVTPGIPGFIIHNNQNFTTFLSLIQDFDMTESKFEEILKLAGVNFLETQERNFRNRLKGYYAWFKQSFVKKRLQEQKAELDRHKRVSNLTTYDLNENVFNFEVYLAQQPDDVLFKFKEALNDKDKFRNDVLTQFCHDM
ncbi:hypothetical protein TKK_0007995 [Trichogramma kaykai]